MEEPKRSGPMEGVGGVNTKLLLSHFCNLILLHVTLSLNSVIPPRSLATQAANMRDASDSSFL
jgi:hypothetical protein